MYFDNSFIGFDGSRGGFVELILGTRPTLLKGVVHFSAVEAAVVFDNFLAEFISKLVEFLEGFLLVVVGSIGRGRIGILLMLVSVIAIKAIVWSTVVIAIIASNCCVFAFSDRDEFFELCFSTVVDDVWSQIGSKFSS